MFTTIRVISRIINALNDFSFIESDIKDVPEVTTEIVGSIIEIAAINAQTSSTIFLKDSSSVSEVWQYSKSLETISLFKK
jgi:hypothetical protein